MQNKGKIFEQDIKSSIPQDCWYYRFKDGTGNFQGGKNENVRFQATNICDCQIMTKEKLFLLELKSYEGTSIPFSGIRKNQIEGMAAVDHQRIETYFLLNFRKIQATYAIEAKKLKNFIENTDRKSIPIKWAMDNGLEIPAEKKRTRFKYDLSVLLNCKGE